jgi:RNA polymerase sigma factor (sigma-70 family)
LRIFDSDKVYALIIKWREDRDKDTLNEVLEASRQLALYIAAKYDSQNPEDLVQEALLKVMSSLDHYDASVANVHTYFSTVIRNACITHYVKIKTYSNVEVMCLDDIENSSFIKTYDNIDDNCELEELIIRNLDRFPSLSPELTKQATMVIYILTRDGVHNKSRGVVSNLVKNFKISRTIAKILYRSTIAYMRMQHITNSTVRDSQKIPEISLLPEVKEFLGDDAYKQFICIFSGTTLSIK